MTSELFWKNFNLGTELQISGNFIYNGLYIFDEMESFHFEEEIFEFLYNISVGLERLMKVVIILTTHDLEGIEQSKLENDIKTHNHSKLMQLIQKYHTLKLEKSHFELLKFLEDFYRNMRYDRFSLENVRNYDKEKIAFEYFLSQYLDVKITRTTSLFATNANTTITKIKMGNMIGKISTTLYDLVYKEAHRLNIYTYEIRHNTKAYKIFTRKEFNFINEHNYSREILIFLLNNNTKHEIKELMQEIKPLDFDEAMIPTYISHFESHLKKLESLDEMESYYDDLEENIETRQEMLNYIGEDKDIIVFDEEDIEIDIFKDIINMKDAEKRADDYNFENQTCDYCRIIMSNEKYLIDGATKKGTWAFMCTNCFNKHGTKIEWGSGQLYKKMNGKKWLLVAGYDNSNINF